MYTFESKVRYSEVDLDGKITFHSILDYFQDTSSFQSEDLQLGVRYLQEKRMAWVLVSWQVEVERYPRLGEHIKISTWPYDFKGFYGYRNYKMTDEAGNRVACANSLWVLLDMETGRPNKILPEMIEHYELEQPLQMDSKDRKIKLPEQIEKKEEFRVQKYHLDTNQHVNNGKYILMAQEYLPREFQIKKMRAEYKKSAVYGDVIYPSVAVENGNVTVLLGDEQQKPYAIVEMEAMYD